MKGKIKMKIGILTLFHDNYNWGGVLQGYALKTLLEERYNAQTDILRYGYGRNVIYDSKIKQALQYNPKEIIKKVSGKVLKNNNGELNNYLANRRKLFKDFMEENTTNATVYSDETLVRAADEYDYLISGSDQVWNPNVGKAGFFQTMISSEKCKKVAYAASIARDDLTKYEQEKMLPLIADFDAVSVRERTAKKFLDKYMGGKTKITEVLDPVLMLPQNKWNTLAEKSNLQVNEKYALAFFFSESIEYRKEIQKYCDKNGMKLLFIPFAKNEFIKSDLLGNDEKMFDVGPYDFVKLFSNAECIFTDSFHGCVFSLIFHKRVCVFERDKQNKVSKNSRLYDLLDKFELSNQLIKNPTNITKVMKQNVDFDRIDKLHSKYRESSFEFLDDTIKPVAEKKKPNNINAVGKEYCCGCNLCITSCPKNCISVKIGNEGFSYPKIDEEVCVNCGQCLKICNQRLDEKLKTIQKETFIGFNNNSTIKNSSSSGGVFYPLAKKIISEKGSVYGAVYNSKFGVEHTRITEEKKLQLLMGSKYVQSNLSKEIYDNIYKDLDEGKFVLFSGTPCQVASIKEFVSRKVDKNSLERLFLVDFICHGVPSPKVWESYLNYISGNLDVSNVSFRDKVKGWHDYRLSISAENGKNVSKTHDTDRYMQSFLTDKNIRESCYNCNFKNNNYCSDITLGDAWKVEKDCIEWADDKGTSLFIVRTEKGRNLLTQIKDSITYKETNYEQWCGYNPSIVYSTNRPLGRNQFFTDFAEKSNKDFWSTTGKVSPKQKVKYGVKRFLKATGLEKKLRSKM